MKTFYALLIILAVMTGSNSMAAENTSENTMTPHEAELFQNCNLEARNALINGNVQLVEDLCTQTINEIEKNHKSRELTINPIMNLAFLYTLSGNFDKATPLYNKARKLSEEAYGPDSAQVKAIDERIRAQEDGKRQSKIKTAN